MSPEVEDEFRSLWAKGVPMERIAKLLGYSLNYLNEYVTKRRDLFPHRHKQFSRETRNAMGCVVRDGRATAERVAKVLGVNTETVRRWARSGKGRTDQELGE